MQESAYSTARQASPRLWYWPSAAISTVVGLGMAWYYNWIVLELQTETDIQAHIIYLAKICDQGYQWPANPGFHWVTWMLAGKSCDVQYLLRVATWVLGTCWGLSTYLAMWAGQQLTADFTTISARRGWAITLGVVTAAVAACFMFSPPAGWLLNNYDIYLGLLPPNLYHNSTLIGAMPFAIAALGLGLRQLRHNHIPSFGIDSVLGLLLVIGALFKPSFAFAFVPAYGICRLLWGRHAFWHHLAGLVLVAVPVALLILGQSWWIVAYPEMNMHGKSEIGFAFPAGWKTFMPNLTPEQAVWLGLDSFALPLLAYMLRPNWLRKPAHQLVVLSTVFATAQFLLVYETGGRAGHGNFIWQVVATNHWLYWLVALDTLYWQATTKSERIRQVVLVCAIAASIVSGVIYLSAIGTTGTYH